MPPEKLEPESIDELTLLMSQGKLDFFSCPQGMVNHVSCHGLMPKKTADGSRHLRFTRDVNSVLEDSGEEDSNGSRRRKRNRNRIGPSDLLSTSHDPGNFEDLFCEFDHGLYMFEPRIKYSKEDKPRNEYFARMNLAQLQKMGEECGFCSTLAQGVIGWKWIWRGPFNKYRYCDNVYKNRFTFPNGSHVALFHAADRGQFDERFHPGPLADEEVALYISFCKGKRTLEVTVQKYPPPDMKKIMSLMTLEYFVEEGRCLNPNL
jgi:hypothetical protein